ncbi:conserved hypothetical protein [Ricinus communis]|uniref:Uncharacterized protein n=1 Tax=Ricinus communis TaxID=3988 RepID=B9SRD0_RICCO|nr:conserved hypothetical protein [Ricinus communis]
MVGAEKESSEEKGGGVHPTEVVHETWPNNHQSEKVETDKGFNDGSLEEESDIKRNIIVRVKK